MNKFTSYWLIVTFYPMAFDINVDSIKNNTSNNVFMRRPLWYAVSLEDHQYKRSEIDSN